MGGIIVDFGDKTIDLSVQSRVTNLSTGLKSLSYSRIKPFLILLSTSRLGSGRQ